MRMDGGRIRRRGEHEPALPGSLAFRSEFRSLFHSRRTPTTTNAPVLALFGVFRQGLPLRCSGHYR